MSDPRDESPIIGHREPALRRPDVDGESAALTHSFYPGLPSGTGIGKYRILERIRTYHNAVVYKARDLMLDRLVAIKQMSPELIDSPIACGNFRREAQLLARIPKDSRYILNIHELIEDEAGLFIVEEFESGHWLESLIFKRQVDHRNAYKLLKTAATGLRTLHAHMIVHRDIQPGNLMVTKSGGAKIANLASAAHEGDLSAPPVITPQYAAPELLLEKKYDNRVDIYGLGLIVYELCVGRSALERHFRDIFSSPFPVGRWIDWQTDPTKHLPDAAELNPLVPPQLVTILRRMTAKSLDLRYSSVDEVLDAIAGFLTKAINVPVGQPQQRMLGGTTNETWGPRANDFPLALGNADAATRGEDTPGAFALGASSNQTPTTSTHTVRATSGEYGGVYRWERMQTSARSGQRSHAESQTDFNTQSPPPQSDDWSIRKEPSKREVYGPQSPNSQENQVFAYNESWDRTRRGRRRGQSRQFSVRGFATRDRSRSMRDGYSPRPVLAVAMPAPPRTTGRGRTGSSKKRSPRILLWTLLFLVMLAGATGGGIAIWYYQYGPGLRNPVESLIDRGIKEYESGNYGAAGDVFEEARRTNGSAQSAPVWRERAKFWLDLVRAQIALENNQYETVQSLLREAEKRGVNPAKVDELQQKAWQKRDAMRLAEEGLDDIAAGNLPAVEAKLDEYAEKAAAVGMDPEKLKDSLTSTRKDMKYRDHLRDGHAALKRGDYLEAITACEKAEELQITSVTRELRNAIVNAQDRKQWVEKGDQAMIDRDFAEAERCYNRAITILPGIELERKSRIARAYVLIDEANEEIRLGNLLEAEKKLKSSLWNSPTPEGQTRFTKMAASFDAARLVRSGDRALEGGDVVEAQRLYEKALSDLSGPAADAVRKKLAGL